MTATEASRSFASLLDEVENGETVVVTRGGKHIAKIVPTPPANGAAVLKFFENNHNVLDEEFCEIVLGTRDYVLPYESPWPED